MNYSRESVFSYVANELNTVYPNVRITSRREPVAKSLPEVYLHEFNRTRPQQYATLVNDDEQWVSTFEAEVYVNDANGAMDRAYAIVGVIEDAFKRLGYFETFCQPIDNIDPLLVRIVSRFTRQIGSGDILPES